MADPVLALAAVVVRAAAGLADDEYPTLGVTAEVARGMAMAAKRRVTLKQPGGCADAVGGAVRSVTHYATGDENLSVTVEESEGHKLQDLVTVLQAVLEVES